MNPELRRRWRKFRHQKVAWRSLLVMSALFLLSLPAEFLCNSKPLLIRFAGRWYVPVLTRYTERDFGGPRDVEPDYLGPQFQRLVGRAPAAVAEAVPAAAAPLPSFDEEPGEASPRPALVPHPAAAPASAAALLSRFDPEPGDVRAAVPAPGTPQPQSAVAPAWMLWPPVRYDYASIATRSRSGRDALAAPWAQWDTNGTLRLASSWVDGHYLGTDDRGRDVLARLVYGYRVSLIFGLLLAVSATVIGTALGGIQGFFGGWTDLIGQRVSEIWGSMPRLYLLMILSSLVARNVYVLFFILNLTSWMGIAAYLRAEFLRGRNFDYVRAARALGVSRRSIMWRHLLPNSLTPIITFFPFMITGGILALVSLDFLNLGVPAPYPSIGEMLSQGQGNLQAVWIIVPTFVLLCGTITLLTFVGDGVRNAFDPRKT